MNKHTTSIDNEPSASTASAIFKRLALEITP